MGAKPKAKEKAEQARVAPAWQATLNVNLFTAANRGAAERIDELLRQGADAHWATPDEGMTALIVAALQGHAECVHRLAKASDLRRQDKNGWTALHFAAEKKSDETLLAALPGSDLNARDRMGFTPLARAALVGSAAGVAALLAAGADPTIEGRSPISDALPPLGHAAAIGWLECVKILARGLPPAILAAQAPQAMAWAKAGGHEECLAQIAGKLAQAEREAIGEALEETGSREQSQSLPERKAQRL
jgi:uncharacterized protein